MSYDLDAMPLELLVAIYIVPDKGYLIDDGDGDPQLVGLAELGYFLSFIGNAVTTGMYCDDAYMAQLRSAENN